MQRQNKSVIKLADQESIWFSALLLHDGYKMQSVCVSFIIDTSLLIAPLFGEPPSAFTCNKIRGKCLFRVVTSVAAISDSFNPIVPPRWSPLLVVVFL